MREEQKRVAEAAALPLWAPENPKFLRGNSPKGGSPAFVSITDIAVVIVVINDAD